MAIKAILFDSSRCSACRRASLPAKGPLRPRACVVVGGYGGARVRGGRPCWTRRRRLPVARFEAARWPTAAPCGRRPAPAACTAPRRLARKCAPPGALGGERRDGFRVSGRGPAAWAATCALWCVPADAPRHRESAANSACATGAGPRWPKVPCRPASPPARWTLWPSTTAMPWCPGPTSGRRCCASAAGPTLQCSV